MINFNEWLAQKDNILICEASGSSPEEKNLMRTARRAFRYLAYEEPNIKFDGRRTKKSPGLYQGDMDKFNADLDEYRNKYLLFLNKIKSDMKIYNDSKDAIMNLFNYFKMRKMDPILTFDFSGETGPEF